jgi:hypothetical protein
VPVLLLVAAGPDLRLAQGLIAVVAAEEDLCPRVGAKPAEPTVRKWLVEGLLKRVEGRRPVEISQRSVVEVERVLGSVRENHPARRWSEALAAFLHDRDLLGQEWAREGMEQLKRGELVER